MGALSLGQAAPCIAAQRTGTPMRITARAPIKNAWAVELPGDPDVSSYGSAKSQEAAMTYWKHRGHIIMSDEQAREGPLGRKVLYVLVASLALVGVAWIVLAIAH